MNIIQSGVPVPFDYTAFDGATGLIVAGKLWDMTDPTPVLVSTIPMPHIDQGMYIGSFTGVAGRIYAIVKSVYTNLALTILDSNRASGSDTLQCVNLPTFDALESITERLESLSQVLNGKSGCGIEVDIIESKSVVAIGQRLIQAKVIQVINLSC